MIERIGQVSYIIALPANTRVDNVFHFSLLKKYVHDPNHVINWDVIHVKPKGDFQIKPMGIIEKKVTMLQNRAMGAVKVQWEHYIFEEATWEMEDAMQLAHPFLFNYVEH